MALSLDQLEALWGPGFGIGSAGGVSSSEEGVGPLRGVLTDSRADLSGALFIPLVGERFDGHAFLEAALLEGGAAAALAQRDRLTPEGARGLAERSGRPIWLVEDCQEAYQQLGCLWRRGIPAPVVAVTGSAGKTTTRELIRAVLAPLGPVVASSGNENNDIGVPLTLMKADGHTAALVVEMGMRGLGEIARLSRCAEPDVAVITNIGTAHIGRLGSREAIARAKCEITTALRPDGLVVIPAGDPLLEEALASAWEGRVRRVALTDDPSGAGDVPTPAAELVGQLDPRGETLTVRGLAMTADGQASPAITLPLPLAGRHNARNLLLALAVAQELGVTPQQLDQLTVTLPGGRSRRLELAGVEILDETYNASPEAVLAALDLLAARPGRHFAVLGTMLELGTLSEELHRQVARRARDLALEGLVIVAEGNEAEVMRQAAEGISHLAVVTSPDGAAGPLCHWLQPGDTLLLKASRGVALERLIPLLETSLAS